MQQALVSIHDVMPATLERVEQLLDAAAERGVSNVTLLVVPGLSWSPAEVDRLRRWQDAGCTLAGHGWRHKCERIRGLKHRLHSWLLSRDVAEHLEATPAGRVEIMQRCADWFDARKLELPQLYVPPAWALGAMSREALGQLPFTMLETQSGVIDTRSGARYLLPLVGFEADTLFREFALRCLNAMNVVLTRCLQRPLRIALHPFDLELRLQRDLLGFLGRRYEPIGYAMLPVGEKADSWGAASQHARRISEAVDS